MIINLYVAKSIRLHNIHIKKKYAKATNLQKKRKNAQAFNSLSI